MTDIFEFWSKAKRGAHFHPDDWEALCQFKHKFTKDGLASGWRGRLSTAKVVLLYLNPGWNEQVPILAKLEENIDRNFRMRSGNEPLPDFDPSNKGSRWLKSRTRLFGLWPEVWPHLAVMNLVPYGSPGSFTDWEAIKLLPSCKTTLAWAHDVLFPQAINGEKIVICLRSAEHWGLQLGTKNGKRYAPEVTRGGHMYHGEMRKEIVANVRAAIGLPATETEE